MDLPPPLPSCCRAIDRVCALYRRCTGGGTLYRRCPYSLQPEGNNLTAYSLQPEGNDLTAYSLQPVDITFIVV